MKTVSPIAHLEVDGRIAYVTLDRPAKRNALSLEMMEKLTELFRDVARNDEAAVAVLRANGSVFSSGHDLSELLDRDIAWYRRTFAACTTLMETIQEIRQPVIAQVQGPATAAGCQLVAACDLAIAGESAWFATPGVKIGLFCTTPMVALTRAVGRRKALEMLLTGDPVPAREALAAGLVNQVVADADVPTAVRTLAARIASSSPYILALGKDAFYRQIELSQIQAYGFAEETMAINAKAPEAHEGISAFLEKRKPNWPRR